MYRGFGGGNMQSLMAQAQKMQKQMQEKMEKAENPELVYEAMVYGLKSFEGEVFFNDNPWNKNWRFWQTY